MLRTSLINRLYDNLQQVTTVNEIDAIKELTNVMNAFSKADLQKELLEDYRRMNYTIGFRPSNIANVEFYPPAVKMTFQDGTVTTAVAQEGDEFNPDIGMMVCIMKYIWGGTKYNTDFRKWIKKWDDKQKEKVAIKVAQEKAKELAQKLKEKEEKKRLRRREAKINIQKEAYLRALKEYGAENVTEANEGITE